MKALIPHMRERQSGTIINVTSTEGISSAPGISIYGSSKFALEGLSEALHGELAPLGIRVLLIEPGGMRTRFLDQSSVIVAPSSEPYKGGIVEQVMAAVMGTAGQQNQDPDRSAQRIVEAVSGGGEGWPENREQYLRLPLGKEVIGRINGKVQSLQTTVSAMEKIWSAVDFDS
jgi:short-subunit dehydrogenase